MNEGLRLDNVIRSYPQGKEAPLEVLRGINLSIRPGEIIALVGPSGSGKSTLLHAAGLLERPDGGEVYIDGVACGSLKDKPRTTLRRKYLGFVYQYHHLLPEFSAEENVVLPQMIAGVSRKAAGERARELLGSMGLAERVNHRPAQLSGGEQQRVAICRALANHPRVLLADEPTGNLDPHTAARVFDALLSLSRQAGVAVLIATHNPELAQRMDRRVRLTDGLLCED